MNNTHDEIDQLEEKPDEEIDLTDIPETLDWSGAEQAKFFRPRKKQISIRLDMDILHWFKAQPDKYQSLINQACREYMIRHT